MMLRLSFPDDSTANTPMRSFSSNCVSVARVGAFSEGLKVTTKLLTVDSPPGFSLGLSVGFGVWVGSETGSSPPPPHAHAIMAQSKTNPSLARSVSRRGIGLGYMRPEIPEVHVRASLRYLKYVKIKPETLHPPSEGMWNGFI